MLGPETDIMGQFMGSETDRMCQFMGPETDIMGERYYIGKFHIMQTDIVLNHVKTMLITRHKINHFKTETKKI